MDTDIIATWVTIAVLIVTIADLYRRSRHDKKEIVELRRQVVAQEQLNTIIRQFAKDFKKVQKNQQDIQLFAMFLDAVNSPSLTAQERGT